MDLITVYPPGASLLASYGASAINLGSWLNAEAGMDFGAHDLIQSMHSANTLTDGGRFSFRYAPPRKWAIPLIINQPGTTTPQAAVRIWEAALAQALTPGAMISVQPEGVPTGQAVFFDVIDGRWEPDYSIFEHRANVRKGFARFETQPYGYWPTEILLACSASIGYIGQMTVNGGLIVGDVPPLARVQVLPTAASVFTFNNGGGDAGAVDMVGVSFAARPSFNPFIPPAVFLANTFKFSGTPGGNAVPTLTADKFAPASQAIAWGGSAGVGTSAGWFLLAYSGSAISSALEPAYRGRFRAFAFMKLMTAAAVPTLAYYTMLDAERVVVPSVIQFALASSNQLATFGCATDALNVFEQATNGYQMLDMGEITLPPGGASGMPQQTRLRLWMNPNFTLGQPANATFLFGGIYLFPVDGYSGLLVRGAYTPTIGFQVAPPGLLTAATQGGVEWNTGWSEQVLITQTSSMLSAVGALPVPMTDGRANYRGLPLRIGASVNSLTLLTGDRIHSGAHDGKVYQGNVEWSKVSVSYRPTFQFLAGL